MTDDGVITSKALVSTERAGRYGKQLASHLGRRATAEWDESAGHGTIDFGGAKAELTAEAAGLRLTLTTPPEDVERFEDVLGRHLVRFGAKDELSCRWTRSDGSAGTEQHNADDDTPAT